MASIHVALQTSEIAEQIAAMLNKYNRLSLIYSGQSLLASRGEYLVEIEGNKVVGVVAMYKESPELTKLFHVCVIPERRRCGIARKLMQLAISRSKTPYVYGTIREDNIASLKMVESLGFVPVKKEWARDHYIVVVGRRAGLS